DVLLAAFCVLLLRVTGREDLQLVVTLDADDVQGSTPLRLRPSWSMSFTDFLQNMRVEVRLALRHRRFAMQIIDSQRACTRMPPLTFDVGFCSRLRREASGSRSDGLAAELTPEVQAGIQLQLLLEQSEPGTGYTLRMEYYRSAFTPDRVQQLADFLVAVVQAVAEAPETPLGELPLESQRGGANEVVEIDAEAEFTF